MGINYVSLPKSITLSNLVKARYSQGRISLPVRRDQSIYAFYKNVSGFPAPGKEQGITLAKLRNLDQLIERIKKLKKDSAEGTKEPGLSVFALDALIEKYSKELHAAAAQAADFYSPRFVETGLILDAVA